MHDLSIILSYYQYLSAIILFLMGCKLLLYVISSTSNLRFLWRIIQNMSGKFQNFMIFFILVISCFVIYSHIQFGTNFKVFNSYGNALMYNIGMMLGSYEKLKGMLSISPTLSIVYVTIYTIFLSFIISNFFQIYVKNEYKRLGKIRK